MPDHHDRAHEARDVEGHAGQEREPNTPSRRRAPPRRSRRPPVRPNAKSEDHARRAAGRGEQHAEQPLERRSAAARTARRTRRAPGRAGEPRCAMRRWISAIALPRSRPSSRAVTPMKVFRFSRWISASGAPVCSRASAESGTSASAGVLPRTGVCSSASGAHPHPQVEEPLADVHRVRPPCPPRTARPDRGSRWCRGPSRAAACESTRKSSAGPAMVIPSNTSCTPSTLPSMLRHRGRAIGSSCAWSSPKSFTSIGCGAPPVRSPMLSSSSWPKSVCSAGATCASCAAQVLDDLVHRSALGAGLESDHVVAAVRLGDEEAELRPVRRE